MKKYKIIARDRIIIPFGKGCIDNALKALNGYFETIIEADDNISYDKMLSELEKTYPKISDWDYVIEEITSA